MGFGPLMLFKTHSGTTICTLFMEQNVMYTHPHRLLIGKQTTFIQ